VVAFWQALIQREAGHAAAWKVLELLPGAGASRREALLNVLDRPYDDALFQDARWHEALLEAAASVLDADAPRWAGAVRSYRGFLAEKPAYWGRGNAEHFLARAVDPRPTRGFMAFTAGAKEKRIAKAQTGRLMPLEDS
jgi:hypothetical protein